MITYSLVGLGEDTLVYSRHSEAVKWDHPASTDETLGILLRQVQELAWTEDLRNRTWWIDTETP